MAAELGKRVRREDLPPSRYSYDYRHDLVEAARGKARDHNARRAPRRAWTGRPGSGRNSTTRTAITRRTTGHCARAAIRTTTATARRGGVGGNPDLGQTRAAQQRAKTHCPQGHELTPDNIYWRGPDKKNRQCKTCTRERAAARHQAQREALP